MHAPPKPSYRERGPALSRLAWEGSAGERTFAQAAFGAMKLTIELDVIVARFAVKRHKSSLEEVEGNRQA